MSAQKEKNANCEGTCECYTVKWKKGSLGKGIIYGIIPHIGCIVFIIGSILGVTVLTSLFRPLLLNRYFFHMLIIISIIFAAFSSALYLRKNELLPINGAKRKWRYLATMFGSTIGINLVLFFLIFPMLANVQIGQTAPTGAIVAVSGSNAGTLELMKLQVDIPCPDHAPLITGELKKINGVTDVKFSFPNNFNVKYDPLRTNAQEILGLEVFRTYRATLG